MNNDKSIKLFKNKEIRTFWSKEEKEWYFSILDVLGVLTHSSDHKREWNVLKSRLRREAEAIEDTTVCSTLKLPFKDGRMCLTDVANVTQLFRIIQSLSSPQAELLKQWMAKIAKERLDQLYQDGKLSIEQVILKDLAR